MKKIFLILTLILLTCAQAHAEGTVDITVKDHGSAGKTVIFTCVGDSSDGSIPDTSTDADTSGGIDITKHIEGLYLDTIVVNPGTPAPDAGNLDVLDEDGIDLLEGNGDDLIHPTESKDTVPTTDGVDKQQFITGPLTVSVENQDTASAQWIIKLKCVRVK